MDSHLVFAIFRGIYSAIMIKATIPALVCLTILASCSKPDGVLMPTASTLEIDADDSRDSILIKAAHVVPTPNQYAALQNEFIAFIHFGPNTFTRMEWGTGMEDPRVFDLQTLDTDQWCAAMKAAGMKRVIFTAKHHDGFCLWQTRYTTHGIRSSTFQNGKGDVMRALSESCRKYGLELGVYLSPADLYQIEHPEGLYGNLSEAATRVIPRPVPGRPFQDTTTFTFKVDDYNEYFLSQLFELLTEYGPIQEVWLDGAHPKRKGGQQYDYLAWKQLIQQLAPEAVVFGRQDVRWCGNEAGKTRDTEWNIIPYKEDPRQMNHFSDLTAKALGERAQLAKGRYLHYQMAETNTSIREGWFYRDDTHQRVRSADDVYDMYERSVGGNSIFLLNIPPNREGRFSDEDVAVLEEVGKRIRETYGENLLAGAKGPAEVLDDDPATFQLLGKGDSAIILEAPEPITINRFRIQEAIATHSERVEAHALYAWQNGEWERLADATNIGYQRILRFPEVTAQRFKLAVSAWRLPPAIATISAHYYRPRLPQLVISRDRAGQVHIQPKQHEFGWKLHGEDVAGNLNRGSAIYYTDGTTPGKGAIRYTSPFVHPSGVVKARAVAAGEQGSVATAMLGLLKNDWTVLRADSEQIGHEATLAFDGDPMTSWCPEPSLEPHYLTIDLGREHTLTGIAYTPPTGKRLSKLEGGRVETSLDGKYFMPGSAFRFGNLINDPTQRMHYFEEPVKARYLTLSVHQATDEGRAACIAEIDILTD